MYNIYYTTPCDSNLMLEGGNVLVFPTVNEAIAYCDDYVKGREPYCFDDTPEHNNHFRLEVFSENCVILDEEGEPVIAELEPFYQTEEYYYE